MTMKRKITLILTILISLTLSFAQVDKTIVDENEKKIVIDSIVKMMEEKYVFPDIGKKMGDYVKSQFDKGEYKKYSVPQEFASKVTEDLQSISKDKHVGIRYMRERIAMMKKAEEDSTNKELEETDKKRREKENFAFKEVSILPGNVGYLKFNQFYNAEYAGPTAIAAMNFLAYTDALIIDLTENGGGSPSLIQLISAYFFEESKHLNSFYIREGDKTEQFWTLPYVPGKKLLNTDIYVLTSNYTFSGAEEFTYNLKNLNRATIIGEKTGGGAHPVSTYIINDNFMIRIPFGRAINPITNTNWEVVGVEPDVEVPRSKAKETAYLLALGKLEKNEKDKNLRFMYQWVVEGLKAKLEPPLIDNDILKSYAGKYGPRNITWDNEYLCYQREGRQKMKMIPLNEDTFMFDEVEYFRLKILKENGKVIGVRGLYDNGNTDENMITK